MRPIRKKRLQIICLMVLALGGAVACILYALKQNINAFYTPSELIQQQIVAGQTIRIGGMVATGSVKHSEDSLDVAFSVTDFTHQLPVTYTGVLPNLFREGKGVVVQGQLSSQGAFVATQVLAKHDENYMPPQVAKKMAKAEAL